MTTWSLSSTAHDYCVGPSPPRHLHGNQDNKALRYKNSRCQIYCLWSVTWADLRNKKYRETKDLYVILQMKNILILITPINLCQNLYLKLDLLGI